MQTQIKVGPLKTSNFILSSDGVDNFIVDEKSMKTIPNHREKEVRNKASSKSEDEKQNFEPVMLK